MRFRFVVSFLVVALASAAPAEELGSWEIPKPDSKLDWVFYSYGSACFGMDWRFLKAVAQAESSLDRKQKTGSYVGLFQWKESDCDERQNMGPFKPFMTCDDLTDPEANTLVSAARFHRIFQGERFKDGALQSDSTWSVPMMDVCPADTPIDAYAALAYVGHNNGPGALKYVLGKLKKDGNGCGLDQQEAAVRSFYDTKGKKATETDVARCNERKSVKANEDRKIEVGTGHINCVNANYGAAKWAYGKKKILPHVTKAGVTELYPEGARNPEFCPVTEQERLYADPTEFDA